MVRPSTPSRSTIRLAASRILPWISRVGVRLDRGCDCRHKSVIARVRTGHYRRFGMATITTTAAISAIVMAARQANRHPHRKHRPITQSADDHQRSSGLIHTRCRTNGVQTSYGMAHCGDSSWNDGGSGLPCCRIWRSCGVRDAWHLLNACRVRCGSRSCDGCACRLRPEGVAHGCLRPSWERSS